MIVGASEAQKFCFVCIGTFLFPHPVIIRELKIACCELMLMLDMSASII
jgi:hypothetical protein